MILSSRLFSLLHTLRRSTPTVAKILAAWLNATRFATAGMAMASAGFASIALATINLVFVGYWAIASRSWTPSPQEFGASLLFGLCGCYLAPYGAILAAELACFFEDGDDVHELPPDVHHFLAPRTAWRVFCAITPLSARVAVATWVNSACRHQTSTAHLARDLTTISAVVAALVTGRAIMQFVVISITLFTAQQEARTAVLADRYSLEFFLEFFLLANGAPLYFTALDTLALAAERRLLPGGSTLLRSYRV